MCGFCGIAYADRERPVDVATLEEMRELLSHRGPDAGSHWTANGVGLGHRRLSVIDLQGGAQPLANEDETVWVTYNGEIYNFQQLTAELKARGHHFRTCSDTEVLVHAYEEYGLDLPKKLNGIFGFALYDTRRDRLLLVRDQLGVKPVFYGEADGTLAFGSEIKAVLRGTGLPARLSTVALQEYLIFRYVSHDRTFFQGVHRLPPGHMLVREDGRTRIERYWSAIPQERREITLSDAMDELDHHLGSAVERQMMSDVPLGAFCSGGVDSGLTTRYAAAASPHRLHTFSVGFANPLWDETSLARNTAARFGTDHHVITAQPADMAQLLLPLIWYYDEPLSHPNAVQLYQLSAFARERVTVVLTGEGADELFSGYPRHQLARLRFALERGPAQARTAIAALMRWLPGHRAAKAAEQIPRSLVDSLVLNSAYVSPETVADLTRGPVDDALAGRRHLASGVLDTSNGIASITAYDTMTYLVCALDRMDRMSMAVGLEARVPFLDVDLVEWALKLDTSVLVRRSQSKAVVKRLAERWLAPEITKGRKSGFGLPLDDWFRGPEFAGHMSRLTGAEHPAHEVLNRTSVQRIVTEHMRGTHNHGELLWVLMNVYLWFDVHSGIDAAITDVPTSLVS